VACPRSPPPAPPPFPPDNPADFARYAAAAVARYRGDAIAWEVWNEENEGWRFWPPREDPAAYARLLCATYPQVKGADPLTPVLFGGVFFPAVAGAPGTSGPDFVAQAYQSDPQLGRCYDGMAYHPYPYPFTSPELDVPVRGSVLSAADQMRAVLNANRDGAKPLWITEVGWPTSDRAYGVPEDKQAQYVARMALATFSEGVPVLTYYTYGDYPDPSGANQEAWFGFFHIDNSPKPSYTALRVFASVFAGTRFVADRSRELGLPPGQQNAGGRGFALQYRGPGQLVTAVWLASESAAEGQGQAPPGGSATPATVPVSVPVSTSSLTVVDYLGQRRTVASQAGKVTLQAGPAPQYVIDSGPGAGGVTRPRSRPCSTRRGVRIHVRVPRGSRVTAVAVYVNGRRSRPGAPEVRRGRLSVAIALPGLRRGRFRVRVVASLRRGRRAQTVTTHRVYRACAPTRRSRHRARRR
jgi:hypothetical protein